MYLSPHLDDAVLSCGGQIHRRVAAGERVLVLTVFAGDPPPGRSGPLEQKVSRWMKLDPASAMAARRSEDVAACRELGAEAVHWPLPEAPARDRRLATLDQLFRPPAGDDPSDGELRSRLRQLPPAEQIVIPLTAGDHRDHHVVRRAAEDVFAGLVRDLACYEDFPYARFEGAVEKALGDPSAWRLETVALDDPEVDARIRAIARYGSQIRPLFASGRWAFLRGRPATQMARAVRAHVLKTGGERLWRRTGAVD